MFISNDVVDFIKEFFKLNGNFTEIGLEETSNNKNIIVFENEKNQYFGIYPMDQQLGKIVRVFKEDNKFALDHCSGVLQIRYFLTFNKTFVSEAFVMSHCKYFCGKAFDFDLELVAMRLGEW